MIIVNKKQWALIEAQEITDIAGNVYKFLNGVTVMYGPSQDEIDGKDA